MLTVRSSGIGSVECRSVNCRPKLVFFRHCVAQSVLPRQIFVCNPECPKLNRDQLPAGSMLSAQGLLFGAAFAFLGRATNGRDSAFHYFRSRRSRRRCSNASANALVAVEYSWRISLNSTFSTCAENVEINEQLKLSGNRKV